MNRKDFERKYQIRFNFREVKAKLTRMKAQSRKTFKVFERKKLTNVYLCFCPYIENVATKEISPDKISKNNI